MPSKLSDETIQRIIKGHELGLSIEEGSAFAGVSPKTFRNECKKLGLEATIKQHGEPQWTKEDVREHLKRIRVGEGIEGLWSRTIRKNHAGPYTAALTHYGGYSEAFEDAFGFPYSKASMYLAARIQELHKSGEEINPVSLSRESAIFRKVTKAGYFDRIYQFAATEPEVRKKTKREIHEVLARMILRHPPKRDSYVTPEIKHVFPAQHREEAATLFEYARLLGLVVPVSVNGITVYRASDSAVETAREMLLSLDSITGEFVSASVIWWNSLREARTPEAEVLRGIDRASDSLYGQDKWFLQSYFHKVLCNPHTYSPVANTYEPRNSDFRRAMIVKDVVMKYRGEDGIPPELRATLQLLPAEDNKTADTLGRYLLGNVPREVGLERLRRMSVQMDAEAVYRGVWEAAGKYGP